MLESRLEKLRVSGRQVLPESQIILIQALNPKDLAGKDLTPTVLNLATEVRGVLCDLVQHESSRVRVAAARCGLELAHSLFSSSPMIDEAELIQFSLSNFIGDLIMDRDESVRLPLNMLYLRTHLLSCDLPVGPYLDSRRLEGNFHRLLASNSFPVRPGSSNAARP